MSTAFKELTFGEATKLIDEALDKLDTGLADLAFEHGNTARPQVSSPEIGAWLERRRDNRGAKERVRAALFEVVSREYLIVQG